MSRAHLVMLPLIAALWGGCARTPDGITPSKRTLVTFEVQVAGMVDPSGYYYILLDTDNDASDGPIPVVARPWGNGYAAGSYTHTILYHGGVFGVYQSSDPNHATSVYLGRPLQAGITTSNRPNDTIVVQLDTSQVANLQPVLRALDVNVVTTDRVPLDPQDPTPKVTDGWGPSGNDFVTIPLSYTTAYMNGVDPDPGHPERQNDAPGLSGAPNLDQVNWRITVQANQ